jgi:L-rhamnose mutarotase
VDDIQRVCFVMHLKPDRVDDYLAAHTEVWPEMLDALRTAGWHNYSLFLHRDEATVVGYLETDDFARATAEMNRTAINDKWQEQMAQYFRAEDHPDRSLKLLTEYFHLA